ncbi:MAG: hypothetical protein IPP40_18175 [bacterium]|nr:hypothetical protein [bacterium]
MKPSSFTALASAPFRRGNAQHHYDRAAAVDSGERPASPTSLTYDPFSGYRVTAFKSPSSGGFEDTWLSWVLGIRIE